MRPLKKAKAKLQARLNSYSDTMNATTGGAGSGRDGPRKRPTGYKRPGSMKV